jgi:MoaA/NifB/PqqE/SkfB family radical SAM enzyme
LSYAHQNERTLRAAAFYPDVPPISLELTSKCNLKCPYCSNGILPRQAAEPYIAWTLLEKLVDECADGRHNLSRLHGTGEPLLWDRLEEAIALIKARRAGEASFATNGTLLNERRIASLLEAGMTTVRVSLDSLDEDIYAATRGGKLAKTIANIRNLIRVAPPDFSLTILLMNHRDQEIGAPEITRFYEVFGVSSGVRLEIVENGIVVDAQSDYRRYPSQVESCWRPSEWFTITYQGEVSFCCSDQVARHLVGDLNRQTIDEVWYDPRTQSLFRNIAAGAGPCPDTCTAHCHLKTPDPKRQLGATFIEAAGDLGSAAEAYILAGEFSEARAIMRVLLLRAPHDATTKRLKEVFEELAGPLVGGPPKTASGARIALIQGQRAELAHSRNEVTQSSRGFGIPFIRA